MTNWQRIKNIVIGFFTILIGLLMFIDSDKGLNLMCGIIALYLLVAGIKALHYYFSMARHMVGGRRSLYTGVILFDLGLFTMSLNSIPIVYIMLYLIMIHAFYGVIDVLNAVEAKKLDTPAWKGKLIYGIGNIVMAVICIYFGFFRHSTGIVVDLYAAGIVYSGIFRIVDSFRRTAIIYIQ